MLYHSAVRSVGLGGMTRLGFSRTSRTCLKEEAEVALSLSPTSRPHQTWFLLCSHSGCSQGPGSHPGSVNAHPSLWVSLL